MKRTGFTLIEVIVSVTIFTIIIVTVYGAFYMGIKTWRRSQQEAPLQKLRLGLLKIEKEAKDSFFFSKIPFSGTSQEMSFPLSISGADAEGEGPRIVTYSIDTDKRTGLKNLVRKEKIFSETAEDGIEKNRILVSSMKDIRFNYAYRREDLSSVFEWKDAWDGEAQKRLPYGIRISLERTDDGDLYNKIIFLKQEKIEIQ